MTDSALPGSGIGDEPAVLEVAIGPGTAPETFRVEVVRSPAGDASAVVELPAGALLARLPEVQSAVLSSAVWARGVVHEAERPVREIGRALFGALLGSGEVAETYRASAAVASHQDQALRVVLRISDPQLAALPWEAMYDQGAGGYVCRHQQVVRHVPVASAVMPLAVEPPLRILGVVSAPRGLAALDTDRERELLDAALARPVAAGLAEVMWASEATWAGLHEVLLDGPWHVVHFIGHGDFDPDTDEGVLALTGTDGRKDLVEASRFADLLRQARPMPRLVVLNSCSGASASATDLFAGTAAALTRAGVIAVTAMQFAISDAAAAAFARGFYTALARGRGVDEAVSAGRISILGTSGRTVEWVTPVLYLRGRHARLFNVQPPLAEPGTSEAAAETGGHPDEGAARPISGPIAASSLSEDHIEVFVLATGRKLRHRWYWPDPGWSDWHDLPLPDGRATAVAAGSKGINHQEIAVAAGDTVHHRWWTGQGDGWSEWSAMPQLGNPVTDLAFSSNIADALEIYALDERGGIHHRWWRDPGWSEGWHRMDTPGGRPVTSIAAGSYADYHQELFAVADGEVWHRWWWRDDGWSDWYQQAPAGMHVTDVAVSSMKNQHLEVFAIDDRGRLRHRWYWAGPGWSDWEDLPQPDGSRLTAITVASHSERRQQIFGLKDSGKVVRASTWLHDDHGPGWEARPEWSAWHFMRKLR